MLFNNEQYFKTWETEQDLVCEEQEISSLNVDATGKLIIVNTGGSSAARGGMGSGSKDKTEKGDVTDLKGNAATTDKDRSNDVSSSDPVGKEIKKAEEEVGDDE